MTAQTAILLTMIIPLVVAALVAILGRVASANVRDTVMVVVAASLFPVVMTLWPEVTAGGRPELIWVEMFPGLPIAFKVEPLGLVFGMVASFLWPVTALYGIGYMRGHHEKHQTRFFFYFSAAISAAMGIAWSGNLMTLFAFYEALTLSTYPLVAHHQDEASLKAGRVYLGILLFTSVAFLLSAIVWTGSVAGTLDFRDGGILSGHVHGWHVPVLLGLFAYGIGKAALMPFHRWLPNAMVAPTPVSALLHAVAVVKAGVFSVMKVVVYVFGLDLLSSTSASVWLMYVAAFTILTASLIAMTKDNLKERLAYSTISQLSYIVLGAAMATKAGFVGGSMHIAMHAFGKITLFFVAGAIYVHTHKKYVSQLDGLGRKMPLTFLAFGIGTLSIIGLPPTGGMWSKWFLALGALQAEQPLLVAVFMISSLLNVAYLLPIMARAFFLPPSEETAALPDKDAPWATLVPPLISAVGCIVLFFWADALRSLLVPVVGV